MSRGSLKYLITIVMLLILPMVLHAQNEEKGAKRVKAIRESNPVNQKFLVTVSGVDTLRLMDRLAVRTNTADWLLLIPNVGAEFDVKPVTWNRWTVGLNLRCNWQTSHTFTQGVVFNLFEARLEGRQYWRARKIDPRPNARDRDKKHTHFWEKPISIRRTKVKHPAFTWFRGLYAAYDKYSFLFGDQGHQGTAIVGGVSYGFVYPMFAFPNGHSLDLEFGVWGGFAYVKDAIYKHDRETDCYPIIEQKDWQFRPIPVISDLRVGLIYRLGNKSVLEKYRYRRDVDLAYDQKLTDRRMLREHLRDSARNYQHDYMMILGKFWHVYDSIASTDHSKRTFRFEDLQMPDEDQEAADKKRAKTAAKLARRQAKDAASEVKNAAKEEKKVAKEEKKAAKEEKKKADKAKSGKEAAS